MTHTTPTSRFCILGRTLIAFAMALIWAGCAAPKQQVEQKPTSFWPPAPNPPRIQFLRSFEKSTDLGSVKQGLDKVILGNEPESSLQITKPYGVRIWQGKIYVCDLKNKGVIILDLRTKLTRMIGVTGNRLQNPVDLAIAPEGTKYVADTGRQEIVLFDASDKQVGAFNPSNCKPVGVAVYNDELAVTDMQGQRVLILDRRTGAQRKVIGSPGMKDGQFISPLGVTYDQQGNLYVCDFMKCRVQKFDRNGKLLSAMGAISASAGDFVRPKHIAVDRDGMLYVVDAGFQNVQLFNRQNYLLTFFGAAGGHPGSMQLPAGITVDHDPQNLELFKDYVHPAFEPDRLIIVTNQFGPNRVAVYAMGKLKAGFTVEDIAPSRIPVPLAATQPSDSTPIPTTIPAKDLENSPAVPDKTPATTRTTTPNTK